MSELRRERRDSVALLTIDRPHRRNALGTALVDELRAALEEIDADPGVRATVLTGSPPGFCAGSDLKEFAATDIPGMQAHEAHTAAFVRSISQLDKPVVVAVDGFALGGGFMLAIGCDVVVTAPEARWHLPEVTIGWIPPWGLRALEARVGPVAARRLAWGGDPLEGREAHRIGLADEVSVDGEGAVVAALRSASKLAALPPEAVVSTKRFFGGRIAREAESADAEASRLFASDCEGPVARETLARHRR